MCPYQWWIKIKFIGFHSSTNLRSLKQRTSIYLVISERNAKIFLLFYKPLFFPCFSLSFSPTPRDFKRSFQGWCRDKGSAVFRLHIDQLCEVFQIPQGISKTFETLMWKKLLYTWKHSLSLEINAETKSKKF